MIICPMDMQLQIVSPHHCIYTEVLPSRSICSCYSLIQRCIERVSYGIGVLVSNGDGTCR